MVGNARLAAAVTAATLVALLAIAAGAETFLDSAKRSVELPAKVDKVLPAGPPAAVVLYTLVPDKLLGWVRAPDD
ncbi:MAG TPA: iron ABC transporter substrate-binding protein, partial [Reyranella sp.]